jgi:predicted ATP-dependent endonuclease of OLD family
MYLEPRCRVLVGINEAGKTNILKALSLLDPDAQIQPSDRRESRPGEPYDQEAYVRFVFVFDEQD